MAQGETGSMLYVGLDMKGEVGAGIEVETEADRIAHRVGYARTRPLEQEQVHTVLYECGYAADEAETQHLAELLSFVFI